VSHSATAATTTRVAIGVSGTKGVSDASSSKGDAGMKRATPPIQKRCVPSIGVMVEASSAES
jgi:hypothetical protein